MVTAPRVVTGPPGALLLLGVTEGLPVALAAPDVLGIADTVAETVKAVEAVRAVLVAGRCIPSGGPPRGDLPR